tara:strand:- start:2958 stop:3761 length:804 start_codon:yes stop_codon:yes gene_type:complete
MNFIKFLFSKTFIINLGLVVLATIFAVFVLFNWLGTYTNHAEYITLNDLSGLTLVQTIDILEDKKLNYFVIDSNTYKKNVPHKSVISQEPLALDKVKEGRIIYLYVSTNKPPMVEIPFLAGSYSKDAGIRMLQNKKFRIGDVVFEPSDSEGDILALLIDTAEVEKGQMAPEGTEIRLVVGGGLTGNKISTPCLIGKTFDEVGFVLRSSDLNIGYVDYGKNSLTDTASAIVYKQKPNPYEAIRIGEPIDVFLIQELPYDINKCESDSL